MLIRIFLIERWLSLRRRLFASELFLASICENWRVCLQHDRDKVVVSPNADDDVRKIKEHARDKDNCCSFLWCILPEKHTAKGHHDQTLH